MSDEPFDLLTGIIIITFCLILMFVVGASYV